jgi:hypothetical protein
MNTLKAAAIDLSLILSFPLIASCLLMIANELYYRSFRSQKRHVLLATGAIGVPIHELSHALVAALFGMKVTKIAFFKPDIHSQTLGYVEYLYNPSKLSDRIGLFFIGVSPIIFGSLCIYGLFYVTGIPNLHDFVVTSEHRSFSIEMLMHGTTNWSASLFAALENWRGVLIVIFALMIGTHSSPSPADLSGSLKGTFVVLLFVTSSYVAVIMLYPYSEFVSSVMMFVVNHLSISIIQLTLLSAMFALSLSLVGLLTSVILRFSRKPLAA